MRKLSAKDLRSRPALIVYLLALLAIALLSAVSLLSGGIPGAKAPAMCGYYGQQYADGERFPAGDGCNSCVCSDGNIACTEMACVQD